MGIAAAVRRGLGPVAACEVSPFPGDTAGASPKVRAAESHPLVGAGLRLPGAVGAASLGPTAAAVAHGLVTCATTCR